MHKWRVVEECHDVMRDGKWVRKEIVFVPQYRFAFWWNEYVETIHRMDMNSYQARVVRKSVFEARQFAQRQAEKFLLRKMGEGTIRVRKKVHTS